MRKSLWHRALPWVSTAALAGCAGEPPPKPAAPPAPVAAPPEPPVDLSPVPEPPTLIVTARWKNVASTLGAFDKMTNLPFRLRQELERALGGAEAMKAVKLDGNAEVAVMLEPAGGAPTPGVYAAFSMPLQGVEEARAAAERRGLSARPLRPGAFRLGRQRLGGWAGVCDIAASRGEAPARLVCARRERELDALVPFLTRGLPEQAVGPGDVSVRVRMQPVRERYGEFLDTTGRELGPMAAFAIASKSGVSDPLVGDTVSDLVGEGVDLLQDLDILSFDAMIDPGGAGARALGAVRFRGRKSWLAKVMTYKNDQSGPPPPIFWQVPKDSDSVGYARGLERELVRAPFKRMGALASALTRPWLAEPDRRAIERVFANVPSYDATSVTASGHVDAPAASKPEPGTPAERVRAARDSFAQSIGWTLYGVDAPPDALKDWLRDVAAAVGARGVQKLVTKSEDLARLKPAFKSVPPPAGLPPRSSAFEFSATVDSDALDEAEKGKGPSPSPPPKKKAPSAKAKLSVLVVIMPDGARTWVGVAADPALVKGRLLSVRASAPAEGKLSSREGLESLRDEKHLSAGFFSISSFTSSLRGGLIGSFTGEKPPFAGVDAALGALPNKGKTPVFVVGDGTGGEAPSRSFELRVRRETVEDAVALALALAMPQQSSGRKPIGPVAPSP